MPESNPSPENKPTNAYLKYGGLAVQLLVVMGIFGWLGYTLDEYLTLQFPAFMLLFGFLAFGGMMYQVYRSVRNQ